MNESTDPEGGKAGAFFALWGRTAHRFAWTIAILAIVSAVAAGIYAARTVKINSDTADMLSAELDFRRLNIELRKTFPRQARDLAVVIDAATPERAERGGRLYEGGDRASARPVPLGVPPAGRAVLPP